MKKKIKILTFCIATIGFMLLPIFGYKVFAEQKEKAITIMFTNDLHDYMFPYKTEIDGEVKECGGYARLQTAILEQKKQEKEALLVDSGDFSMGTPIQTIFKSDAPELRILGEMGYDAVTLGNHEFDYRADGLAESLRAAKNSGDKLPQIVQSNVTYPKDKEGNLTESLSNLKQAMNEYGVKDYIVLERNGVKIGIFGVMGEESASMAPMSEVEFEDEITYAKQEVKILQEKEKVDFIICLSHSGTKEDKSKSEDELMAKAVPEIDVIISGHTHTKLEEPIVVGDTVIGSNEDGGKTLGVMKLSQDEKQEWKLENYELVDIDNSLTENESISKRISEFKEIVQKKYFDQFNLKSDQVLARTDFDFETPNTILEQHQESNLGNFISDAFMYAVKEAEGENYIPVAATIVPAGTIRGTFFEGNVTVWDAFNTSSLGMGADNMPGYPLISVYMTGKEIKAVCEVDASITSIMKEAQLFLSGVNFTFNPNRLIFNKVTQISLVNKDGSEEQLKDDKLYRVVAGLYSAQMLSVVGEKSYGLLEIVPKTQDGTPITDYESQIIYSNENGKQQEVKEWLAVVSYLESFEEKDSIPQISEYYSESQGRKVVDDNHNIIDLVKNPNHIAIVVYAVLVVFLAFVIFIIKIIVKKLRKKKAS